MRRFVIGDLHGAHKALLQVLKRSGFDKETDLLISLGDVVDGWPEAKECVDELLTVRNLVFILGNHDQWLLNWIQTGEARSVWLDQGGRATLQSYQKVVPDKHREFFENAPLYHVIDNIVFVHGGLNPFQKDMGQQDPHNLLWGRSLFHEAFLNSITDSSYQYGEWDKIFIGHTPTLNVGGDVPLILCNVVAMDTGAGWNGKLSIMDIDSG